MDDWKNTSEHLQNVARWKTPQEADRERRKGGLVWLCIGLSGGVATLLAGATGSVQVFWLAWIALSAISVGMITK